jgi:hypothetical protein
MGNIETPPAKGYNMSYSQNTFKNYGDPGSDHHKRNFNRPKHNNQNYDFDF